jgi:hypothetical protein
VHEIYARGCEQKFVAWFNRILHPHWTMESELVLLEKVLFQCAMTSGKLLSLSFVLNIARRCIRKLYCKGFSSCDWETGLPTWIHQK